MLLIARLYADENFALPVVLELRRLGHDVLTTQEAGKAEQAIPDDEVLQFASDDNRSVLTFNRKHFMLLHREIPEHCGIVVCTDDPDFASQAARIDIAVRQLPEMRGLLLRVNRPLH